jgi:hypothetical protein
VIPPLKTQADNDYDLILFKCLEPIKIHKERGGNKGNVSWIILQGRKEMKNNYISYFSPYIHNS